MAERCRWPCPFAPALWVKHLSERQVARSEDLASASERCLPPHPRPDRASLDLLRRRITQSPLPTRTEQSRRSDGVSGTRSSTCEPRRLLRRLIMDQAGGFALMHAIHCLPSLRHLLAPHHFAARITNTQPSWSLCAIRRVTAIYGNGDSGGPMYSATATTQGYAYGLISAGYSDAVVPCTHGACQLALRGRGSCGRPSRAARRSRAADRPAVLGCSATGHPRVPGGNRGAAGPRRVPC